MSVQRPRNIPETTQQIPAPAPETPLPPVPAPSLTVTQLKEKYLDHKTQLWRGGEYASRSLMSIKEILPRFADAYPIEVPALTAVDFSNYRAQLIGKWKYTPHVLNRHVSNIGQCSDGHSATTSFRSCHVGAMDSRSQVPRP